ncbi:cob(I)yrinic acid a,c-diamide adenosyltransferase [Candidatus Woesearchaeota archaeon]|nr:cob(I)yrinic acid a,c-diamide adenosyltransferase [Candidatus Woesearchaeota archaeon]
MMKEGLIHVYTGNGKGKTTTSLGMALRAAGHGLKVNVIQFLKGGGYCGEFLASKVLPNLEIKQFGQDCPWAEEFKKGSTLKCGSCRFCFSVYSEDKDRCGYAVKYALDSVSSGRHDLVILDEINSALNLGLINKMDVKMLINKKHPKTELILTGRGAHEEILEMADYATEMKELKHPMQKGTTARRGIEF